jgi:hypothetical protein
MQSLPAFAAFVLVAVIRAASAPKQACRRQGAAWQGREAGDLLACGEVTHQLSVIQVGLDSDPNAQVQCRTNRTVRGSAFPSCGAWAIRNHRAGTAQRRRVPISHQELKGSARTHREGKSTDDRPLKAVATGVGCGVRASRRRSEPCATQQFSREGESQCTSLIAREKLSGAGAFGAT